MTNEEFQRLVLQELGEIKGNIGILKDDVDSLKEDVGTLKDDVGTLKENVIRLEEGQQSIIKDVTFLKEDVGILKEDVIIMKEGQKVIKALIEDLDPQNANRHIEIISQINGLREDLNTIEVITSKNWNDIAKLKSVK